MPKTDIAVDTTEMTKNVIAACALRGSERLSPTSTKAGSDTTSSATMRLSKSLDAARTTMPLTEASSRKQVSPGGSRSESSELRTRSSTTTSAASTRIWKNAA